MLERALLNLRRDFNYTLINSCHGNLLFISYPFFQKKIKGTNILDNLLHWGESKQRLNFLEIGFLLARALSGSGILFMQRKFFSFGFHIFITIWNRLPVFNLFCYLFQRSANKSAGVTEHWLYQTGQGVSFLGGTQVAYEDGDKSFLAAKKTFLQFLTIKKIFCFVLFLLIYFLILYRIKSRVVSCWCRSVPIFIIWLSL